MSHDERDNDGAAGPASAEGDDTPTSRGPVDVEAAFADIVAHWDDPSSPPVGSWPAQEDLGPIIIGDDLTDEPDRPDAPPADRTTPTGGAPAAPVVSAYDLPLAPPGWTPRPEQPVDEPEGYVPPEPPPLPRGDPIGWLAWAAVLGGPLFLLLASQVWTDVGRVWIMLAVLAFIGGFAAIVARLPNSRGDDDTDDGAVV